jgi:starch synthase
VGGLADTIIDANEMPVAAGVATGIQFSPVSRDMLEVAISRAQALWRNPKDWRRMQANGMRSEVGWSRPARHYAGIYSGLAQNSAT